MIRRQDSSERRAGIGKWDLAAVIGLLAIAFAVDRLASDERNGFASGERNRDSPSLVTEDGDRGRMAASASEIPAKGWKDILLRVYGDIGKHRILALAAGTTYYTILAIFPALAALVAIYGLFSDPARIAQHLNQLGGFLPGGAIEVAREQLTRVASKGGQTLGWTFIIGLAISLWSANAAM